MDRKQLEALRGKPVRVLLGPTPIVGVLRRAEGLGAPFEVRGNVFHPDQALSAHQVGEEIYAADVARLVALPMPQRLNERRALANRAIEELGRSPTLTESWLEAELVKAGVPTFKPEQKDALLRFEGYGVDRPRIIFLGAEEALPDDPLINLWVRCSSFTFPRHDKNVALSSFADAYEKLDRPDEAEKFRAAGMPGGVQVWKFCAMLAAAVDSEAPCVANGPWREGWRDEYMRLGSRAGGHTLLAELYPFPKPKLDAWPREYVGLFGATSAGRYFSSVWPKTNVGTRPATIKQVVGGGGASHLFQYGRGSGGEFWSRLDGVVDLVSSTLNGGKAANWHVVDAGRIEVGLGRSGMRVARLGFPWGRNGSSVTDEDVPTILNATNALVASRP